MMRKAVNYINEILCTNVSETPISKEFLGSLPMYITQTYRLYDIVLFDKSIVVMELINEDDFSISQTDKHSQLIRNSMDKTVVLVLENLQSYNRKRLIEKGINFIVPGKQLFLPELLINLSENYSPKKSKSKSLKPSSQFLFLYHIIHTYSNWKIEKHSFKEIAKKLNYTPMAITNAVEELKQKDLIEVNGDKEKYIKFNFERSELWHLAQEQKILASPVLKTVFVDELPHNVFMLKANVSALSEYSSLNPNRQNYYAIEKNAFYYLQKNNGLVNANDREGQYALEIWKYDPLPLVEELHNEQAVVDPLSLYLSLQESQDERIEMGLEQIIEKMIW